MESKAALRSKQTAMRRTAEASCGAPNNPPPNSNAKEEHYRRMNAQLEARTAALVREAEEMMRDQHDILSKPIPNRLDFDFEDDSSTMTPVKSTLQQASVKEARKKKTPGNQRTNCKDFKTTRPKSCPVADDIPPEALGPGSTILHLEEQREGRCHGDTVEEARREESVGSEAQIRVLKAKLRIMQEQLDRLSHDHNRKEDENAKLCSKIKDLEEDQARLQKTANVQRTHLDKHRAAAGESGRRCAALQLQLAGLQKEVEGSTRAQKQASGQQTTAEVRLNRALEEGERLKAQLTSMKQLNKDQTREGQQTRENLLAENEVLRKQKEELILGFKKQLRLIDILKRQKMHSEAAKMLSFTEDEFMKALDWGMS